MSINPITPRTETVVVLQGDDDETLRALKTEVDRISAAKPKKSLAPRMLAEADLEQQWEDDKQAAEAKYDAFAEKAKRRGVKVILRALGRKTYRKLVEAHPAREGEKGDVDFGFNVDAFQEELVPLCMASPVGTDEERSAFLDSLNEGQFGDLAIKAWTLNMGKTADPTQRLSSADSRTSNGTSS